MAGKGISINFLADVRRFLRGTDDVTAALDDVADSLDDAARDGDDATEKLERSFRDLTSTVEQETRDAGRELGRNMKRGADDASDALQQVKDDGLSNAKEVAASFDGSAQSIAEGFQGAAAEAFTGFGPAGAAAGLLAAAGLGIALQAITEQQEAAEELKANLTDAYKSASAEGKKYIDQAAIDAAVLEILFDESKRAAAIADAEKIGVDTTTYVRALAGDADALKYSIEQAEAAHQNMIDEIDSARGGEAYSPQVQAIKTVQDELGVVEEIHNQNREAQDLYTQAVEEGKREEREQIRATREAEEERWTRLAERYAEFDGKKVTIDTELKQPSIDTMLGGLQRRLNARRLEVPLVGRYGREIL